MSIASLYHNSGLVWGILSGPTAHRQLEDQTKTLCKALRVQLGNDAEAKCGGSCLQAKMLQASVTGSFPPRGFNPKQKWTSLVWMRMLV